MGGSENQDCAVVVSHCSHRNQSDRTLEAMYTNYTCGNEGWFYVVESRPNPLICTYIDLPPPAFYFCSGRKRCTPHGK